MPNTFRKRQIGENLRSARKLARLSQGEVAQEMRLSRQMIGMWESGRVVPTALQIVQLAELYGTPTDLLLLGIAVVPVALIDSIPLGVCAPLDAARTTYRTYLQLMSRKGHDSGMVPLE